MLVCAWCQQKAKFLPVTCGTGRSRPHQRHWLRGMLAAVVVVAACLPWGGTHAQVDMRLDRVESYIPRFAVKKAMNRAYRPELSRLQAEMQDRMAAGENLSCSAQIFDEAHWLVNFTDRKADVEQRIADLRESLKEKDQTFAIRQDPRDGSFGPCHQSWIWRFDSSVDPLKELAKQGKRPPVPLKIWEPVDTPEKITALMRSLLISDTGGGHNKRKELNKAITALGQLLWLDSTEAVFPGHLDRDALAGALTRFVDEEWQVPETGYWGAWYRDGETVYKTNDLSLTFHIVSYRNGDVRHHDRIARTTFGIRNVEYPYGWDTGGTQNNHHAYDVARIINLVWDRLDTTSRARANAALYLMTARSVALSVDGDGVFDPRPYTSVAEAYYFGVSFFSEVGLFGNPMPVLSGIKVIDAPPLLAQIQANLAKLHPLDPWVAATRRKLEALTR